MLDKEWITLILEAKNLGIKIEDVRNFFHTYTFKES
ncbi:anti-repressor SinI family protein [Bacillus massiliigorillae]|nr:anti-repressor SinI family protein [Bacillus massiliigorillae]